MGNRFFASPILGAVLLSHAVAAPLNEKKEEPNVEAKLRDKNDSCTVRRGESETILEIRSPKGISRAVVRRLGERWPTRLIVKLQLGSLENFEVFHGKVSVAASVGYGDRGLRMRQWSLGDEKSVLAPNHPLYLPIRRMDRDGKPANQAAPEGWFEISLPAALFDGNPESITLDWIDAYRN